VFLLSTQHIAKSPPPPDGRGQGEKNSIKYVPCPQSDWGHPCHVVEQKNKAEQIVLFSVSIRMEAIVETRRGGCEKTVPSKLIV
jgi:hypothetical protein